MAKRAKCISPEGMEVIIAADEAFILQNFDQFAASINCLGRHYPMKKSIRKRLVLLRDEIDKALALVNKRYAEKRSCTTYCCQDTEKHDVV